MFRYIFIICSLFSFSQEFIETSSGYLVDNKCQNQWTHKGKAFDFALTLENTIQKGLRCFQSIGLKNNNYEMLQKILRKKVTVMCSQSIEDFNWYSYLALAHASGSASDTTTLNGKKISHPFLSVSPFFSLKKEIADHNIKSLQKTLFHEQIHNLGYLHGRDVEYSEACAECCFGGIFSNAKDLACKICSSKYEGITDPNYLDDYIPYSHLNGSLDKPVEKSIEYLKKSSNKKEALYYLILANMFSHTNLGNALLEKSIERKILFSKDKVEFLKSYQSKIKMNEAASYNDLTSYDAIASILIELYVNKNKQEAIEIFFQHADAIYKELEELNKKKATELEYKNVQFNILKNMEEIIRDMLTGYPDNTLKDESSTIFLYFDRGHFFDYALDSK